ATLSPYTTLFRSAAFRLAKTNAVEKPLQHRAVLASGAERRIPFGDREHLCARRTSPAALRVVRENGRAVADAMPDLDQQIAQRVLGTQEFAGALEALTHAARPIEHEVDAGPFGQHLKHLVAAEARRLWWRRSGARVRIDVEAARACAAHVGAAVARAVQRRARLGATTHPGPAGYRGAGPDRRRIQGTHDLGA